MGHTGRPTMLHTKLKDAPSRESDARGPWSHEQLERMNDRFVQRVERAIASGQEQPTTSANLALAQNLK